MLWNNCGQYLRGPAAPASGNNPVSGDETSPASDTPASDVGAPDSDAESDNETSSAHDAPASHETSSASDESASQEPHTLSISRRKSGYGHIQTAINVSSAGTFDPHRARQICDLQELYSQYVREQCEKFPIAFWRVFGSVIDQSKRTQSKVFAAVKPLLSARDQKVRHFSSSWAMHARHFFATV